MIMYQSSDDHEVLPSFPTRRSSDLGTRCGRWHGSCTPTVTATAPSARSCPTGSRALLRSGPTREVACGRSEEHTSELQSRGHLVCRLLLEKKKRINN